MKSLTESQATLVRLADIEDRGGWEGERNPVRYWGTEIEHPRAGQFLTKLIDNTVFETKTDPTVKDADNWGDNKCECRECAHDCGCNQCQANRSQCRASGHNEVALMPCLIAKPRGFVEYVECLTESPTDYEDYFCHNCECECDDGWCENCESGDDVGESEQNWGFHTHIDARDLTLRQVGSVVRLGTYAMKQFPNAFGADEDTYNSHATGDEIQRIGEGEFRQRPSVNASGILNYLARYQEADREDPKGRPTTSLKATVEFRSFRSTDHGILHLSRVATARAIVDYIAEGKPVFWLLRERDLEKFLTELEIWKH